MTRHLPLPRALNATALLGNALLCTLFLSAIHAADTSRTILNPTLFFTEADIPALKERVRKPEYSQMWATVLADARDYCDPASPRHANAEKFAALVTAKGANDASHLPGRNLTVWMQTLGLAWTLTGDETFARNGTGLLEAAASEPVTAVLMRNQFAGARGDMMRALAIGLDQFAAVLTPTQRSTITRTAHRYINGHFAEAADPKKNWWIGPHNFTGVCGGALGLLAIALRDDFPDESPRWINAAETTLLTWLDKGLGDGGAGVEGVGYMSYGLTNTVLFADALWRTTRSRKAIIEHPHLRDVPHFLAMERLPGENAYDARNDSLYNVELGGRRGMSVPWLLPIATGFHGATAPDPLAVWLWNTVKANAHPMFSLVLTPFETASVVAPDAPSEVLPAPFGQHYAERGLCVWRTGWEHGDVMFSIEAGPYHPVTHNQADKGHFTLYGLGYRWAADVGYGNNREPEGRCQTVAHSCVLIDGKGQGLSGGGRGTNGKILNYQNTDTHGYALVDAKAAYDANTTGEPGIPVKKALRHTFFIRPADSIPAYAVVLDDIQAASPSPKDQKNGYTWQMITWANMNIEQPDNTPGTFVLTPPSPPSTASSPETQLRMIVALRAAAPLTLTSAPYRPDNHGGRPPNDYKRLRAETRAVNPRFAALLAPLPAGAPTPVFAVEDERVIITWPTRTDTLLWRGDTAIILSVATPPAGGLLSGETGVRKNRHPRSRTPRQWRRSSSASPATTTPPAPPGTGSPSARATTPCVP